MTTIFRTQFWGEHEDDDRLVRQILRGEKTATCCPRAYFGDTDGDYHEGGWTVGDRVEVHDLKDRLRCIIEITEVYDALLGDPPEKLWRGECNASAGEFIDEHLACWQDLGVTRATPVTVTHFVLRETVPLP